MEQNSAAHRAGLVTDLQHAALFALAYFAGSELGYALSLGPSVGGTFWPPAGISLAAFLASRFRSWPLLVIGGAAANFTSDVVHGQLLQASIGFTAANLAEPVLGAFLVRLALPGPFTLTRLPELGVLILVVALASTPVAAAFGAFIAERFTPDPPGFAAGWRTWWVGDMVGALVVALGIGGGAAIAGGDDDATERPITGRALEQAEAAALAHTGEGRVTDTEVGDEESYYEVEVRLDDGREVDVQLDEDFSVVGSEREHDGRGDD